MARRPRFSLPASRWDPIPDDGYGRRPPAVAGIVELITSCLTTMVKRA